jgi:lipopolysaccharide export system permease protein
MGFAFCGLLFAVGEFVVPQFMDNANRIWLQEVRKKNIYATRTKDIWMRAPRQIIHIKKYSPEDKRISGVTIHIFDEAFRLIQRMDAESGVFENGKWHLGNVLQQSFGNDAEILDVETHEQMVAGIDLNPEDLSRAAKRSDEMGLAELARYIQKVEREGYAATRYRVDYHGKIAAPFVCIFLSVLGTAIALRGRLREGMPVSITYGLGIAFIYWIFNSFCISLGYAEMLPPVVAAWIANLVFSCASGFLLLNAK